MKPLISILSGIGLACAGSAWAGNAQMMQKNAEALIQLNEQVVKQVGEAKADGHILLEARIKTGADGKNIIYIDQVSSTAATPVSVSAPVPTSSILAPSSGYRTFIHQGDLPIPVTSALKPVGGMGEGGAASLQDFSALLNQNPQARVRELTGAAIESLTEGSLKPQRGFVIYW